MKSSTSCELPANRGVRHVRECVVASLSDRAATVALKGAAHLLDQQFWCWGQDIVRGTGNLLLQYGFDRIPPPQGSSATSVYRLTIPPQTRLILRGFGVFLGSDQRGGLFLRRDGFHPQLTPAADLPQLPWTPGDLPPLSCPWDETAGQLQHLLLDLIAWIGDYEAWVVEELGLAYRRATLVRWNDGKRSVIAAERIVPAWQGLRAAVAKHPDWFVRRDVRRTAQAS